jgi:putative membrane protein
MIAQPRPFALWSDHQGVMVVPMKTWVLRIGLAAVANAVTLLIAAAILSRFTIDAAPFIIAVAIFTAAILVFKPVAAEYAGKYAKGFTWFAALVVAWLGLLVTDALSDGINIEGFWTWVWATLIVWVADIVYDLVDDTLLAEVQSRIGGKPAVE